MESISVFLDIAISDEKMVSGTLLQSHAEFNRLL